jgi:hypothetical protein
MLVVDYFDGGRQLMARVPVDVGNDNVDGVVVRMEPGMTINGRVRVESAAGTGAPAQSWGLTLTSSEPGLDSRRMQWDKGSSMFSTSDLTPGRLYDLRHATRPVLSQARHDRNRDLTRDETPITQSGLELDVVLADEGGVIQGPVEDADGKPFAGGAGITVLQDGRLARLNSSGPDGHFRIQNIAPGNYRIYAWDNVTDAEFADEGWMKRHGGYGQSVTVASGQTATVELTVAAVGP